MIKPEDKILSTSRLDLEPLVAKHAELLYDVLQDKSIYTYISEEPPVSVSALRKSYAFLEKRKAPSQNELWLNWALKMKDSSRYIGTLQATIFKDNTANIAYVLSSEFRNMGIATEVCLKMLEYLFNEYHIKNAVATVDVDNKPSLKLLNRLGFTKIKNPSQSKDYLYHLLAKDFNLNSNRQ